MSIPYRHMSPQQQRKIDERDLRVLRLLDAGVSYDEICATVGISKSVITKIKRILGET